MWLVTEENRNPVLLFPSAGASHSNLSLVRTLPILVQLY